MNLALVVMTDGRGDYLARTLQSARTHLIGQFTDRVIHDDSGDVGYRAWLESTYGHRYTIVGDTRRVGQAQAVANARQYAKALDPDYVFWLEDDFVFRIRVVVKRMVRLLEDRPYLAQVALLRQPWFAAEREAGGIIQMNPGEYVDHEAGGLRWVEHRQWYTLNPHLFRGDLLDVPWPSGQRHEWNFGRKLVADPETRFAYLGRTTDRPAVYHIGADRARERR